MTMTKENEDEDIEAWIRRESMKKLFMEFEWWYLDEKMFNQKTMFIDHWISLISKDIIFPELIDWPEYCRWNICRSSISNHFHSIEG